MCLPLSKPCPHLTIQIDMEEQPYFDGVLSEVAYHPGSYTCLDCLETVYFVDGHCFTKAELDAYHTDVDSIPF